MEGVQYIQHRVIDGTYMAFLYWKIQDNTIFIKEGDSWKETAIPVKFVKDFEYPSNPPIGASGTAEEKS